MNELCYWDASLDLVGRERVSSNSHLRSQFLQLFISVLIDDGRKCTYKRNAYYFDIIIALQFQDRLF